MREKGFIAIDGKIRRADAFDEEKQSEPIAVSIMGSQHRLGQFAARLVPFLA